MRFARLAATLLMVANSTSTLAQQSPGSAPKASQEGTSAPPADPFKNAGRPESNAGSVQQPGHSASAHPPSPELTQSLLTVSRTTLTAQQYGHLASMRHTSGTVHQLGDRMAVTNSRINKALTSVDPKLANTELMPPSERSTFDSLARHANESEFGVSVAQWVAQNYPPTIAALEGLAHQPALRGSLTGSIAELKSQLADAEKMLQASTAQPSGTGSLRGSSSSKSD